MEMNTNVCVGAQNKPKDSHVSQSHCLVSQKRTILHTLAYCSTLRGANTQIDTAAKCDSIYLVLEGKKGVGDLPCGHG